MEKRNLAWALYVAGFGAFSLLVFCAIVYGVNHFLGPLAACIAGFIVTIPLGVLALKVEKFLRIR